MKNNKNEKLIVIQGWLLIACIITLLSLIFRFGIYLDTLDPSFLTRDFPIILIILCILSLMYAATLPGHYQKPDNDSNSNNTIDFGNEDDFGANVEEDPTKLKIYKASMRNGIVKYPEGFLFKSCKECYHYIMQSDYDIKCCYHCDHGSNYIDDTVDVNGGEYNGESTKGIRA